MIFIWWYGVVKEGMDDIEAIEGQEETEGKLSLIPQHFLMQGDEE